MISPAVTKIICRSIEKVPELRVGRVDHQQPEPGEGEQRAQQDPVGPIVLADDGNFANSRHHCRHQSVSSPAVIGVSSLPIRYWRMWRATGAANAPTRPTFIDDDRHDVLRVVNGSDADKPCVVVTGGCGLAGTGLSAHQFEAGPERLERRSRSSGRHHGVEVTQQVLPGFLADVDLSDYRRFDVADQSPVQGPRPDPPHGAPSPLPR